MFFFFYLWGDRKKVSEINMFDVRLSFFIITCSMKQRRSRKKPRLFNKSFKTLLIKKNKIKLCKKTSQKSFCQNVHWSRAVHTDHLLQRLRPVRVSRPVEREITFITLNFSFNHVLIMFMKAFAIKQRPLFCKHNWCLYQTQTLYISSFFCFFNQPDDCSQSRTKIQKRVRSKSWISLLDLEKNNVTVNLW